MAGGIRIAHVCEAVYAAEAECIQVLQDVSDALHTWIRPDHPSQLKPSERDHAHVPFPW